MDTGNRYCERVCVCAKQSVHDERMCIGRNLYNGAERAQIMLLRIYALQAFTFRFICNVCFYIIEFWQILCTEQTNCSAVLVTVFWYAFVCMTVFVFCKMFTGIVCTNGKTSISRNGHKWEFILIIDEFTLPHNMVASFSIVG